MKRNLFLILGVVLVVVAGVVGWIIQTDDGRVAIRDVRFMGANGKVMSALLYIPKTATAKTPAPGILAVHGYINSRETQSGFAIEFARRGYVVLALDQTGHGYSDPPAFANGFGGPDGLKFLRSLDFVDKDNIGMEGHSMGGWTLLAAAAVMPDAYKSAVLEGSSTGAPFAAEGSPTWPKNLAVVYSKYDEFSVLMWGVPRALDVTHSDKLKKVFGTTSDIEPGKVYGSIADGTARVLYTPTTTHPGDHISNVAIGYSIDWFGQTLKGGSVLPSTDQIWIWKELATLVGFIGFVFFLLGMGRVLLGTKTFAPIAGTPPTTTPFTGAAWWLWAAVTAAIPVVFFYLFMNLGAGVKASWLFPQTITSQIMVWALMNGAIFLVLFIVWHFTSAAKRGANAATYGLVKPDKSGGGLVGLDLLYAIAVVFAGYVLLSLAAFFFKIDFRFWVVALKPMSRLQFGIFLRYLIPFAAFFFISSMTLHAQYRLPNASRGARYFANMGIMAAGFLVFLLLEYITLFARGMLLTASEPLNTIVAIQFLPLMIVASIFSTWFYENTGRVWAGSFVNALLITWYIAAGQATQFPL
ncbi:MAG TPA: alpha/beta fold hydrolase [Spirochaetia bacterium]|nr:alpha/beta fold hydrolase [Spirochaetia bacterium]